MTTLRTAIELTRSWRGRLILAVVTTQLLLPALYYVARRDPHDERFAWRMFSPMRMVQCTPRMTVGDVQVDLNKLYHQAWITMAKRGRFAVIEAMAADQCRKHPGASVRVSVDCRYLDADDRTWGGYNMCDVPEL